MSVYIVIGYNSRTHLMCNLHDSCSCSCHAFFSSITLNVSYLYYLYLLNGMLAQFYFWKKKKADLFSVSFYFNADASHVSMSVAKLLSRIVDYNSSEDKDENKSVALTLHENTFGITTDPLTQFSCILSALIHDVDHQGVPNSQLIKEGADIASIYKVRYRCQI